VTVGRKSDQVKPNSKKRVNLRVLSLAPGGDGHRQGDWTRFPKSRLEQAFSLLWRPHPAGFREFR
jgi:hypothetical protein